MTDRLREFRLHCAVADYLRVALRPEIAWSYLPFGEHRTKITGARLKRAGTQRGWPDFLILANPAIGIECKSAGAYQSPEQKELAQRMIAAGHVYVVARDLDTVQRTLDEAGLRRAMAMPPRSHAHRWTLWHGRLPGGKSGRLHLGCACGAHFIFSADALEAQRPDDAVTRPIRCGPTTSLCTLG